jgi:hypothetical protein
MASTILIIAGSWLALDALIVAVLVVARSRRRATPSRDVVEALAAACPVGRRREGESGQGDLAA